MSAGIVDVTLRGSAAVRWKHEVASAKETTLRYGQWALDRVPFGGTLHLTDLIMCASALSFTGAIDRANDGNDMKFEPDQRPGRLILEINWKTT